MEYKLCGPYLIVGLGKELDHHQVEIIQKEIEKIQREHGYKHLIFDFSKTCFMDSSGVGMIISRYKQQSLCGGSVSAVGISPMIERLFYVSGLHKIIRFYPEVEDVFNEK